MEQISVDEIISKLNLEQSTIISKAVTSFTNVITQDNILVDGMLYGQAYSIGSKILVSQSGMVKGYVSAKDVYVNGVVMGNIHAFGKVIIYEGALVDGDIRSKECLYFNREQISGEIYKVNS